MKCDEIELAGGEDRFGAVIAKFSECGSLFRRACDSEDYALAQEAAMAGLWVISRLFRGDDADAHSLILSMIGSIVGAKWGRTDHVLLQATCPIDGTRKGLGHAYLAGFSISACRILTDQGRSKRASRRLVAKLLAECGCTLSSGEHGEPLPISEGAIRGWCEGDVQLHHEMADELVLIHSEALRLRGQVAPDAVVAYFREQAEIAMREFTTI